MPCGPCVPDLAALAALGSRCVIVTAPGDGAGVDCVSRVFAPGGRHPRGPRHRIGALHAGGVLG